jgi:hypothetical protein
MMLIEPSRRLTFFLTALRFNRFNYTLQSIAGLISIGLGFFIIYEKAFLEGLFN